MERNLHNIVGIGHKYKWQLHVLVVLTQKKEPQVHFRQKVRWYLGPF
jgi:hypothetical protein